MTAGRRNGKEYNPTKKKTLMKAEINSLREQQWEEMLADV
jgi:hypothetical protein